jgi:hypothetical protein
VHIRIRKRERLVVKIRPGRKGAPSEVMKENLPLNLNGPFSLKLIFAIEIPCKFKVYETFLANLFYFFYSYNKSGRNVVTYHFMSFSVGGIKMGKSNMNTFHVL